MKFSKTKGCKIENSTHMKKPKNTHTRNEILRPMPQWSSRLVFDPIVRCAYRTRRFVSSKLRSKLSIVELWSGRWISDRWEDRWSSGQREFAITPIGVWSNREMWWPNEKVWVNQAPIKVIDRRAMIRSMDFRPLRRSMEFRLLIVAMVSGFTVQCTVPQACHVLPIGVVRGGIRVKHVKGVVWYVQCIWVWGWVSVSTCTIMCMW